MASGKTIRLSKLAREFNVGIHTIVEFLHKKGFDLDSNPNTKVSEEAIALLEKEYKIDLNLKKESEKISLKSHRPKQEVISIEDQKPVDEETEEEEAGEEIVMPRASSTEASRPKPVIASEKREKDKLSKEAFKKKIDEEIKEIKEKKEERERQEEKRTEKEGKEIIEEKPPIEEKPVIEDVPVIKEKEEKEKIKEIKAVEDAKIEEKKEELDTANPYI